MKEVRSQNWTDVVYRKTDLKEFKHWSNMVLGKGDESLKPSSPMKEWKKFIILIPKSNPTAKIRPGFYSEKLGICRISSAIHNIADGPFVMRMGPEDCYFFVIGTDEVNLDSAGYIYNDFYLY